MNKIKDIYKVVAYDDLIEKKIHEAEIELAKVEKELDQKRKEYEQVINKDGTEDELVKLEQKIEDLEKDRDEAEKDYKSAMNLTVEDLQKEHAYERWKGSR
jgi:outer membrane protein TolC